MQLVSESTWEGVNDGFSVSWGETDQSDFTIPINGIGEIPPGTPNIRIPETLNGEYTLYV